MAALKYLDIAKTYLTIEKVQVVLKTKWVNRTMKTRNSKPNILCNFHTNWQNKQTTDLQLVCNVMARLESRDSEKTIQCLFTEK